MLCWWGQLDVCRLAGDEKYHLRKFNNMWKHLFLCSSASERTNISSQLPPHPPASPITVYLLLPIVNHFLRQSIYDLRRRAFWRKSSICLPINPTYPLVRWRWLPRRLAAAAPEPKAAFLSAIYYREIILLESGIINLLGLNGGCPSYFLPPFPLPHIQLPFPRITPDILIQRLWVIYLQIISDRPCRIPRQRTKDELHARRIRTQEERWRRGECQKGFAGVGRVHCDLGIPDPSPGKSGGNR